MNPGEDQRDEESALADYDSVYGDRHTVLGWI